MPRTGRPKTPIVLSEIERHELEGIARSRSNPVSLVRRARIILMAADGALNIEIAKQVGLSGSVEDYWRKRFRAQRLMGLHGEARPGAPLLCVDEKNQVQALERTQPILPLGRTPSAGPRPSSSHG